MGARASSIERVCTKEDSAIFASEKSGRISDETLRGPPTLLLKPVSRMRVISKELHLEIDHCAFHKLKSCPRSTPTNRSVLKKISHELILPATLPYVYTFYCILFFLCTQKSCPFWLCDELTPYSEILFLLELCSHTIN